MFLNTADEVTTEVTHSRHAQVFMLALGLLAMVAGTLVYMLDRPATTVYFIPDSSTLAATTPLIFGTAGGYLPAFFHALAFALIISSIGGRRYMGWLCLGWFVAEVFFELAQLDAVAFFIVDAVPRWFVGLPLLENIASHFVTGVFSTIDVLFLLLGCGTAFIVGSLALPRSRNRHRTSRPVRLAAVLLMTFIGMTSILGSGGTGAEVSNGSEVSTGNVQRLSALQP